MRLAERDASAVLEAAATLMEAATLEELVACAFSAVRRVVDCELVIYNEMKPRERRSFAVGDPPEPVSEQQNELWELHMLEHPVLEYALRTGETPTLRISDFLSWRAFHASGLWADVYRPIGVDDQLASACEVRPGHVMGVSANRTGRTFGDRERDRLDALSPFLAVANRRVELERLAAPAFAGRGLTRRERETLQLAVRGWTNREIAAAFVLSPRTVAKHLEHAYAKLGVSGRRGAARLVERAHEAARYS